MKRTVAKASVWSRAMGTLGFGGGEFFKILPASSWVERLFLSVQNGFNESHGQKKTEIHVRSQTV